MNKFDQTHPWYYKSKLDNTNYRIHHEDMVYQIAPNYVPIGKHHDRGKKGASCNGNRKDTARGWQANIPRGTCKAQERLQLLPV